MKFSMGDEVKITIKSAIDSSNPIGERYKGIGWVCGALPKRLTTYGVIGKHETSAGDTLYAIRNASGQTYLCYGDGLRLAKKVAVVGPDTTLPDSCGGEDTPSTEHPKWIRIYHEGDTVPEGEGEWSSPLIIYDNDTGWYCHRNRARKSLYFQYRQSARGGKAEEELDPVRAAAMLLVFADEEAEL